LRIAYVAHVAFPDVVGDPFNCLELAKKMSERGHETAIITWNKRNPSSNLIERVDGVEVWRLAGVNFRLDNHVIEYPFTPGLADALDRVKPDVVHCESHLFLTTVQAVRKAKKLGLPCVVTVHGVFADRSMAVNFAQFVYLRTLGLEVFRSVDRVICLTQGDAEEVVRFGCPLEKIRLVPNAVDTERFKPCEEREDNLVVWAGRFVPEKGLEYLVEAAKIVSDKFEDVRFLLVGDGPLKARIMKLAYDLDLLDRVVFFAGPLSRDEVAEVLGKAAVFVFPSLKEGLPLSVLEAMACGLPVVGSNISGIDEIIIDRRNGFLVPPKNPQALAEAALTLLNDENLRKRIGLNARQQMMKEHSWDTLIGKVEKIYNSS
jgi:glycosyltransferase involved in cell wall biosynthesis